VTYTAATFTVGIWLSVGRGEAEVGARISRPEMSEGDRQTVDRLAYARGLAKQSSIPTSARTAYEMRHSLAALAQITQRLLDHPR
jgi:hypothetical protein